MLTFDNVRFQYAVEDFSIIDHLSFEVQNGEFVSIIGASGCGKSTIFRLVNKLLTPASGVIRVDGESIETKKNYCGYMPQQDLLFPWRTVRENLMLPMEIQGGYSKEQMQKKADDALRSVGLADWGDKTPKELSGGMRQRAAFARTVLTGSDLLLLDEPFSALDYLTRLSMREWLLEQWEKEFFQLSFRVLPCSSPATLFWLSSRSLLCHPYILLIVVREKFDPDHDLFHHASFRQAHIIDMRLCRQIALFLQLQADPVVRCLPRIFHRILQIRTFRLAALQIREICIIPFSIFLRRKNRRIYKCHGILPFRPTFLPCTNYHWIFRMKQSRPRTVT